MFSGQGRYIGQVFGDEETALATAQNLGARLVEGDFIGFVLPYGSSNPSALIEFDMPPVVDRSLDFGNRVAGDYVVVDGEYTLIEQDGVFQIDFADPGTYVVEADFLGFLPIRAEVTVP